jgi:hypothetical protein
VLNFSHDQSVVMVAERLHLPVSWMVRPRALLGAGALGLVIAFAVPAIGTAAACGLVLYFLVAAGFHIRAHDTRLLSWVNWAAFFLLAVAALSTDLAYRDLW